VSLTYPIDWRKPEFQLSLGVDVSGTIDYTVQYTLNQLRNDDQNGPAYNAADYKWWPHETLVGDTADATGNLAFPVSAVRLLINSLTAGATITFYVTQR